jgi:hypothetical protein
MYVTSKHRKKLSVGWKSPKDSIILQREQAMVESCSDVVWIKWPLGSPDLTPWHFLWGYTKVPCVRPVWVAKSSVTLRQFWLSSERLPCDWRSTHRVSARFVQNFWSFRRWYIYTHTHTHTHTHTYTYIYTRELLVRRICFPCHFENGILFVATPQAMSVQSVGSRVYLFINLSALSVPRPAKDRRAQSVCLDAEPAHMATLSVTWLISVSHVAASTATLCHRKSFTHSAFMWWL